MAEDVKSCEKSIGKEKSEKPISSSSSQCSGGSRGIVNSGRLSLSANAKVKKVLPMAEGKTRVVEKDAEEKRKEAALENYHLEYSKYLLRKVQNRLLSQNKKAKEDTLKKGFVSLKLKFEQLLEEYVKLNEEVGYFQMHCDLLSRINKKIDEGGNVLRLLKETEFESLMKNLSNVLDCALNQLELVNIDKNLIDEAFRRKIWGSGSEIELCLKKIESFLSADKDEVSKIAGELVDIKKLALENAMMREKFSSLFKTVSTEVSDTNYQLLTGTVKKAFEERECKKSEGQLTFSLGCDLGFLHSDVRVTSSEPLRTKEDTDLEGSCSVLPGSSSTPEQDK